MANRSGMGPGLAITITLLALTTVGFFVTTVISAAEAQKQKGLAESAQNERREALGPNGTDANWERIRQEAGSQGAVPYLSGQNRELIGIIGGSPSSDTVETLTERANESGANGRSLLQFVTALKRDNVSLRQQADAAEASRRDAERERDGAFARLESVREDAEATSADLNSEIEMLRAEVEVYRSNVSSTTTAIEGRFAAKEQEYDASVAELRTELRDANDRVAQLSEQVRRLTGETRDDRLSPRNEEALVDGLVVNIDTQQNEVYINRGAVDNIVLGMTFEVYGRGVSIRPDERGVYPRGKATIEVVRIEETNSVGRMLTGVRGNPVLPADRIVNAVWDPDKEYRFVVFGNFDANGDGFATPSEKGAIEAIVGEWGGIVEDELTGRTDFVILGERPILPPEPRADDPFAVVDLFLQKRDIVDRYDRLFSDAGERSIPVLNLGVATSLVAQHMYAITPYAFLS
ncbi:MAG: hypothetical protein AAGH64_09180, partial [Planctomycetota bacterium]